MSGNGAKADVDVWHCWTCSYRCERYVTGLRGCEGRIPLRKGKHPLILVVMVQAKAHIVAGHDVEGGKR